MPALGQHQSKEARLKIRFTKLGVKRPNISGNGHPNWKGGKTINNDGYIMIMKPDHPFCNYKGYIGEHRLVYEESHNCCLLPWIEIHHIDGNPSNNVWYNLTPMSKSEHARLSNIKDMSNLICCECNSNKTYLHRVKVGLRPLWYYKDGRPLCGKCQSSKRHRHMIHDRLIELR